MIRLSWAVRARDIRRLQAQLQRYIREMLPLHFTTALLLVSCLEILTTGLDATKKAEIVMKRLKNRRRPETVRLRGGRSPEEGNVEIIHEGVWGNVCDDEWDSDDGQVVCRQLGYQAVHRVTHNSQFGNPIGYRIIMKYSAKSAPLDDPGKYWMDNVYCDGGETGLAKCRFDGWGNNDCGRDEAAGVICVKKTESVEKAVHDNLAQLDDSSRPKPLIEIFSLPNFRIRLAGGRDTYEGRVEVRSGSNGEEELMPHVLI